MPIRVGFVGLSKSSPGWASSALAPPLFSEPLKSQYVLSALSTSSGDSATKSAAHIGDLAGGTVRAYHGSTDSIAADDELDLVVVAVKAPSHRNAVLPLLEKGRNVFVEWPVGRNIAETKEFVAKAQAKGIRTMAGLQGWQIPAVKKIREIIAKGDIGNAMNVTWVAVKQPAVPYWTPFVLASGEYAMDPSQGATLADVWLGHNFSVITRALGPLVALSATGAIAIPVIKVGASPGDPGAKDVKAESPDQYSVSGVFESGALFTGVWRTLGLEVSNKGPTLIWLIDGSKGQVRVELDSTVATGGFPHVYPPASLFLNDDQISLETENAEYGGNTGRAWAEYARGTSGAYPTFEDALLVKQHVEAVKQSASEGKRVMIKDVL